MKKSILLVAVFLLSISVFAQTRVKTMFYNLTNFGATSTKTPFIIPIIDDYQPDIIMVAELTQNTAANNFLNNGLNKNNIGLTYTRPATYTENTSPVGSYEQFIFYNANKLELVNQYYYPTTVRDINRFTFKILGDDFIDNPIYIEIFVNHLAPNNDNKARQSRLDMVYEFTNILPTLPTNSYVLFTGDLNLYSSNEPAYLELLDATNAILLKDPINRPCDYIEVAIDDTSFWGQGYPFIPRGGDVKYFWNNNPAFKDIHTQNPKSDMDDRFDFILTSENILNSTSSLTYVPNSYLTYGNNNGECYNKSIIDITCQGNTPYSQVIRNALFAFSDHLPVVMELEAKAVSLSVKDNAFEYISFASSNVTSTHLNIKITDALLDSELLIYNQLGEIVKRIPINIEDSSNKYIYIDVQYLSNGVYFINNSKVFMKKPLKFVKF